MRAAAYCPTHSCIGRAAVAHAARLHKWQKLEFAVQVLEFPVQEILEFAVQKILEILEFAVQEILEVRSPTSRDLP